MADPHSPLLDKPRDAIDADDWKQIEGWKVPSIVSVSLDAGLKDERVAYLERWLEERDRYSSNSLRRLLHRLCDEAGIETANRKMSWYTIRHSVGTYIRGEARDE